MVYENFSGNYTKAGDEAAKLAFTTTRCTCTGLYYTDEAYIYCDKGAGHFTGNFEHKIDMRKTVVAHPCRVQVWALWNSIGSSNDCINVPDDGIIVFPYWSNSLFHRTYMREREGGSAYTDYYQGGATGVTQFLTIARVSNVLTCKIYSDSARTSLTDTLTITLQSTLDYRYIYGMQSVEGGNPTAISAWCENLDLQELDLPTVTTQAATGLTVGAGTLHGTITATGGENADERGFDWDYDTGEPYAYEETDEGDYGTGAFEEIMSGFTEGNTVYFRAKANNSAGWGYGGEESFVVRKAITRTASGAIGVVGVSGRGFVGVRTAVGAFGMVGTSGRMLASIRTASAAIGITGATDRLLHSIRSASAAIGMAGVTGRILYAVRSAAATMSVVGISGRSWIGTRTASAALGVTAVAGRIKGMIRTASASMGMVGTAARKFVGSRTASASFSTVATSARTLMAKRAASASMGLAATSGRMLAAIRSASASMSMVGITNRVLAAFRDASASMGVAGTAVRSWVGTRSASASMAVTGATDRMLHSIRSASASLNQVATATRSGVFTRTASASMAVAGTASRIFGAFRSAGAAISAAAVATRSQVLVRTQSASMGITAASERVLSLTRTASASMGIIAVGGFFRRVIRGLLRTTLGGRLSSLGFGGRTIILKEGGKEVKGEVSKKDG